MNNLATQIILNDFDSGKRIVTVINASDLDYIKKVWTNQDHILAEMQEHPAFGGRSRWCDLDPKHFTMMIISFLNAAADVDDEERINNSNKIIASLHFLYAALILCLQTRTDSLIEMIRINRMVDGDITYDYTATFNIFEGAEKATSESKSGLRLVVNNEDKE
jgi:hypothetical protein